MSLLCVDVVDCPAPDPRCPRYCPRPFPRYAFVPGKTLHPRRHPQGHSYGRLEPKAAGFLPVDWHRSEDYLYGVDLYNFGYWWECHEVFEALWHAVGQKTEQGNFFQALIQLAAANLKRSIGAHVSAEKLLRAGLARLQSVPPVYLGLDVRAFVQEVHDYFIDRCVIPALIRLDL